MSNISSPLMHNKRGLVIGIANQRSIAWAIAKACSDHGAEVALTYQNESLERRVRPLAKELGCDAVSYLDFNDEASVQATVDMLAARWGKIDFVVHAVAYAERDALVGRYIDTTLEAFTSSLAVSCYSLTTLCRHVEPIMNTGGSILTLTYYGAEKVMPHYNVMGVAKSALEASVRYLAEDMGRSGVRVNAISAGPIKTLAASGIGDFRYILRWNAFNSPLRRNVDVNEVGRAGLYMLSDLSSGVTGEVHHVDCGYHVVGMKAIDAPDVTLD